MCNRGCFSILEGNESGCNQGLGPSPFATGCQGGFRAWWGLSVVVALPEIGAVKAAAVRSSNTRRGWCKTVLLWQQKGKSPGKFEQHCGCIWTPKMAQDTEEQPHTPHSSSNITMFRYLLTVCKEPARVPGTRESPVTSNQLLEALSFSLLRQGLCDSLLLLLC